MNVDEVISGRAGLEGIQLTVAGKATRQLIRSVLRSLIVDGSPGRLRLTRVKYKPGKKLSAYFLVPVLHTQDAFKARPIAISWKLSGQDQSGMSTEGEAMEAEIRDRQLSRSIQKLWKILPGQNARLTVWPYDPTFPQLPRMSDGNYVSGLDGLNWLQSKGNTWEVIPIRYRPGERHVLFYNATKIPRGKRGGVYAKLYRDPIAAERAARIALRAVEWLAGHTQGVGGVRPLSFSGQDGYVLYPHAPGTPFSHLLGRLTPDLLNLLRKVGTTLRVLHASPAELAAELEERTIGQEIKAVARACEHIQALLPGVGSSIDELLDWIAHLSYRIPSEPPTFTHSDFKADHLLISPLGVTIIDFDTCARTDPAIDPGKFLADLEWWFSLNNWEGVEQAQAAFLEGYSMNVPADRLVRARLYQALVLIKITARRAKLSDQNWADQVMHNITRTRTILRELAVEMGEGVA